MVEWWDERKRNEPRVTRELPPIGMMLCKEGDVCLWAGNYVRRRGAEKGLAGSTCVYMYKSSPCPRELFSICPASEVLSLEKGHPQAKKKF